MLARGRHRKALRLESGQRSVTARCALRTARRQRGQAMIEFLLALPLLLLIFFLIVTFGRGFRLKQRAVVASRHASWQTAQAGGVGRLDYFQRDFFYSDPSSAHGGRSSPNDGKQDFAGRLDLTAGVMTDYWDDIDRRARGESRQRAAVTYEPPGSVYRYALERIGETTTREFQSWHWRDVNLWRFFGEEIMEEATDGRADALDAFDRAGRQGIGAEPDAFLRTNVLQPDMTTHQGLLDRYYGGWISSWQRG